MTERNTTHATFVIEKTYPASPARVFKAFADEQAKARWFAGPDGFEPYEKVFDFRVGGHEVLVGRHGDAQLGPGKGMVSAFYCDYQDIVPNERIVYAYRMSLDGVPISASLATIEIAPEGTGARLTLTEYGVYLDGYEDKGSREHGSNWLMDKLGESLQTETA